MASRTSSPDAATSSYSVGTGWLADFTTGFHVGVAGWLVSGEVTVGVVLFVATGTALGAAIEQSVDDRPLTARERHLLRLALVAGYVVASFFLSIVGGLLVAVVVVVLLIPFGLLFALGIGVVVVAEPIGTAVLVVTGVVYGLSVLVVAALVQVPVQTYLRYYPLLVLGDVEPELDLIPDQRAAVRDTASA